MSTPVRVSLVAEHGDRPEPEVARIHRAQLRHVQRTVRLDALDHHGQLVHVRHDPYRRPAGDRARPLAMVARPGGGRFGADVADQVPGVVDPHVVDQGSQFTGAYRRAPRPPGRRARMSTAVPAKGFRLESGSPCAIGSPPMSANGNDRPPIGYSWFAGSSEVVAARLTLRDAGCKGSRVRRRRDGSERGATPGDGVRAWLHRRAGSKRWQHPQSTGALRNSRAGIRQRESDVRSDSPGSRAADGEPQLQPATKSWQQSCSSRRSIGRSAARTPWPTCGSRSTSSRSSRSTKASPTRNTASS